MSFSDILKDLLKELNISQAKLAAAIGFSQRSVSKWVNAQAEPTETAIVSCAEFFGITADEMLGLSDTARISDGFPAPSSAVSSPSPYNLTKDETELLIAYRKLSYAGKARVSAYTDFVRDSEADLKKRNPDKYSDK